VRRGQFTEVPSSPTAAAKLVRRCTQELTSVTDRDGRLRTFGYDNAGRETSEVWRDGSNNAIRTISYTYDAAGHLATASDSDSSYSYTYDNAGRLASVDNQGTPGVPGHVIWPSHLASSAAEGSRA
jgi:YD repeat-containing protein